MRVSSGISGRRPPRSQISRLQPVRSVCAPGRASDFFRSPSRDISAIGTLSLRFTPSGRRRRPNSAGSSPPSFLCTQVVSRTDASLATHPFESGLGLDWLQRKRNRFLGISGHLNDIDSCRSAVFISPEPLPPNRMKPLGAGRSRAIWSADSQFLKVFVTNVFIVDRREKYD